MLSPKWLARCTTQMTALYAETESTILDDMARRISTYDFYIPAAQYQEEKLTVMGVTRQQIIAELSKRTGKTRQEIEKIMEAGVRETRSSDGAIYEQAGKTVPEKISPQMRKIIRAGLKQTAGLFENLTKTTAQTATRQFEKALDLAWLQVSTGAMDPQSATRQAIKSLCKAGIQAVAYSTGRSDTLEVAVTRALRTGVNQTALRMQEQLADEMGTDLVEVTAHAGARPDHAKWQGKVYSLTGKTPGYQTLAKATGYGTGAGLGGWGCRHGFFPHFLGQNNTYSKDELEEYTRPDAVEYNGKKMSLYEAEQTQRSIERQIRRWKREDNALKAAGLDTTESSAKVKLWNSRYKDFCAKTGLKQQKQRSVVYTHLAKKNVATPAKFGILKETKYENVPVTKQSIDAIPLINPSGWTEETSKKLQEAHRELLRFASKQPVGVEVGTAYDLSMKRIDKMQVGERGRIYIQEYPVDHIVIHNHPSSTPFSEGDITLFIRRPCLNTLTAVGNNGCVYLLHKTDEFDGLEMCTDFFQAQLELKKFVDDMDIDEYIERLKKFLREAKRYGVEFIEG